MESIRFFDVPLSEITIDAREIYLLMGYGDHTPSQDILDMIDQMLLELRDRCKPHFGYRLVDGEIIDREHITIENNTILNPGRIITSAMRKSEKYTVFTVTAGNEFDEWFKDIEKQNDIVKSFISNTLGSVIAESTVTFLMKKIEQMAHEEGLRITNNYSPGYCDWLLIEQRKLFSLFPPNVTGIELTDSCLMLPIKSVSGIVGIGKDVRKRAYGCDICNMTTCIKNKKKAKNNDVF